VGLSSGAGAGGGCNNGAVLDEADEQGPEEAVVQLLCAASSGELEPDDEEGLQGEVPGEVAENGADGEGLDKVEEAKDDPVCEPLGVIGGLVRLNGEEGEVRGESEANQVGDDASEGIEKVEKEDEEDGAGEEVGLGDLCALLQGDESGILAELCVELRVAGQSLLLDLDEEGVLLEFLSGRHRWNN